MQGEVESCKLIPTEGTICVEVLRSKKVWHVVDVEKLSANQCAGAQWERGLRKMRREDRVMQGFVGGRWIWILNLCKDRCNCFEHLTCDFQSESIWMNRVCGLANARCFLKQEQNYIRSIVSPMRTQFHIVIYDYVKIDFDIQIFR